jgi:hypothetical protein
MKNPGAFKIHAVTEQIIGVINRLMAILINEIKIYLSVVYKVYHETLMPVKNLMK